MKKYKIVSAATAEQLEKAVLTVLNEPDSKWAVVGAPFYVPGEIRTGIKDGFHQALASE